MTEAQKEQFEKDGFIILRTLFSDEEIDLLYKVANDASITENAYTLKDANGLATKLTLWFTPGDDTLGLMSRSERLIRNVQDILGEGEVCHFHSKVMQKEPKVGGAWEWHQDYGYWYQKGFLYPDALLSVMVALTDADKLNGCLQVLKGSHKIQRIEHVFSGEQQGADMNFVKEAEKKLELVYCELKAGDVLFFHSNLLHKSDANRSEKPRWSVISAYNLSYNKPFREENMSCIHPVNEVSDTAILENGYRILTNSDFLDKEKELNK